MNEVYPYEKFRSDNYKFFVRLLYQDILTVTECQLLYDEFNAMDIAFQKLKQKRS